VVVGKKTQTQTHDTNKISNTQFTDTKATIIAGATPLDPTPTPNPEYPRRTTAKQQKQML